LGRKTGHDGVGLTPFGLVEVHHLQSSVVSGIDVGEGLHPRDLDLSTDGVECVAGHSHQPSDFGRCAPPLPMTAVESQCRPCGGRDVGGGVEVRRVGQSCAEFVQSCGEKPLGLSFADDECQLWSVLAPDSGGVQHGYADQNIIPGDLSGGELKHYHEGA
jgi:hypothetical protein